MARTFTKSAASSANLSYLQSAIACFVGCLFVIVSQLADQATLPAKLIFGAVGALAVVWGIALFRQGRAYAQSSEDWRVELTGDTLRWHSAAEKVMASFEVPYSNIQALRHVQMRRAGKGGGYRNEYSIELLAGETIQISENVPGVSPAEVFEALEMEGVTLERESYLTKDDVKAYRKRRKANRNKAQPA